MVTHALITFSHLDVSILYEYVIGITILIPRGRFLVEVNAWDPLSMHGGTNHVSYVFQYSRGSEVVVRKSNHLRPIYRLCVPDPTALHST
jgi:hypothetical protein